ncbi:MAG: Hsp20/alpha crystallin family protein [bacterium]
MTLVKWIPRTRPTERAYDAFDSMIQDLFTAPWNGAPALAANWLPATDVLEAPAHFTVKIDLPGMRREDIKISVQNETLSVTGSRDRETAESDKGYSRVERSFGAFTRTFQIPNSIDAKRIEAIYKDGVLTVTLPKSEESQPKQIEVRVQ